LWLGSSCIESAASGSKIASLEEAGAQDVDELQFLGGRDRRWGMMITFGS
ncbi:hypothetical protein AVEN_110227-1, partial [Araneus ventricosus]